MKKNILFAVMMMMVALMTACSNDERPDAMNYSGIKGNSRTSGETKTVLVYMAGKNDLSNAATSDLMEMKEGSKRLTNNDNLLAFVRQDKDEQPYLVRIKNGELTDTVTLKDMGVTSTDGQNRASDPLVMEGVLNYVFKHYPATNGNYGLVLWGHGTGWLMEKEVKKSEQSGLQRGFGIDIAKGETWFNGLWINIPTMAKILKNMPHLKFIMGDCCHLMCLENLYELRSVADYIIGSPAEIPAHGAPYDQIVPDMFADGKFYTSIIDKYHKSVSGNLPLSAVQTSEMENVAKATREALQAVNAKVGEGKYADMTGMIHYVHTDTSKEFLPEYNLFYDAGDYMRTYAPADVYQQWNQAPSKAVVELRTATRWAVAAGWHKYEDFTVTKEKMHGVSMFVAQDPSRGDYAKYNEDIKQLEWYSATVSK